MHTYGQKFSLKHGDDIFEIVGIIPAGSAGRKEPEYEIRSGDGKFNILHSLVDVIFNKVGSEEIAADIVDSIQQVATKSDIGAILSDPEVGKLESTPVPPLKRGRPPKEVTLSEENDRGNVIEDAASAEGETKNDE